MRNILKGVNKLTKEQYKYAYDLVVIGGVSWEEAIDTAKDL